MTGSPFEIVVRRSARKELRELPAKISGQVERALDRLLSQLNEGQRPQDMKPLKGMPGTYRLDSGEYRILFSMDDAEKLVTILRVRHRKDVYRNL
ncbi:MAG: type II toxin-antitoxin system RelE/ParE family toxin [Chloroflexi bacterium]|nr:type II toxin-antitoxin system RelE/ParE family toxin [Chloroflexota bacterium]